MLYILYYIYILPQKYCSLYQRLYEQIYKCVQVNRKHSQPFIIYTRVQQGRAEDPELFSCIIGYVMMRMTTQLNFGLKPGDRLLSNVDFTSD